LINSINNKIKLKSPASAAWQSYPLEELQIQGLASPYFRMGWRTLVRCIISSCILVFYHILFINQIIFLIYEKITSKCHSLSSGSIYDFLLIKSKNISILDNIKVWLPCGWNRQWLHVQFKKTNPDTKNLLRQPGNHGWLQSASDPL